MSTSSMDTRSTDPGPWATGLAVFAGAMMMVLGTFHALQGIVALVNDDFFVADELLFGDLSAWGVWWLVSGAALLLTGAFVLARNFLSVIFAISLAGLNALTQLMWIGAYPAWSIAAIVVDGLIIWALTTRFDEFD
jgi:hypothetical protein